MTWSIWHERPVRTAIAALAVAALALGASIQRGLIAEVVMDAPSASLTVPEVREPQPREVASPKIFDRFVDGSPAPAVVVAVDPALTLLGTVVGGDTPSATIRLGSAGQRLLHLGDVVAEWRLVGVEPGRALFIDAGGRRHELRINPVGN